MRLTVADVNCTVLRYVDAVRARQFAGKRVAIRPVAALACSGYGGDNTGFRVDAANRVVLGIGNIEGAVRGGGNAFGPVQLRLLRCTAVPGISLLPRACDQV